MGGGGAIDLRQIDAISHLHRHRARSLRQCYIEPNATCPVCGSGVYFYANRSGSRVFFDELGPPWPKHPCTDRPKVPQPSAKLSERPIQRHRGLAMELVEAARRSGMTTTKFFGIRGSADWSPAVVVSVDRRDDEWRIVAEHLDSTQHEKFQFVYFSDAPILDEGSLISVRDRYVSFVHPITLETLTIRFGDRVAPRSVGETASPPHEVTATSGLQPTTVAGPALSKRGLASGTNNLRHFGATDAEQNAFVARMADVLKALGADIGRDLGAIATRLNRKGVQTATGEKWTHQLVFLLMSRLPSRSKGTDAPRRPSSVGPSMPHAEADSSGVDALARKFAAIGRVTTKGRRGAKRSDASRIADPPVDHSRS